MQRYGGGMNLFDGRIAGVWEVWFLLLQLLLRHGPLVAGNS